jgi:hypothetical protein
MLPLDLPTLDLTNTLQHHKFDPAAITKLLSHIDNLTCGYDTHQILSNKSIISSSAARHLKNSLTPGTIVGIYDKNPGLAYEECPVRSYERIKKEVFDLSVHNPKGLIFEELPHAHPKIITRMELSYHKYNLDNIIPWQKGSLPKLYVNAKFKDPNKNRLISSCFDLPAKKLLSLASKAFTFLLAKLPPNYPNFTLHNISHLKRRTKDVSCKLRNIYGVSSRLICKQTDVEQMFTYLDHKQIMTSIFWLCDTHRFVKNHSDRATRSTNDYALYVQKHLPHACTWQVNNSQQWLKLSLSDLIAIATYDLENTYATVGPRIFKQKNGAPMGGFLSSNYANIKCSYDEYKFLTSLKKSRHLIQGIRQIDDLLVWTVCNNDEPATLESARILLNRATSQTAYPGGLKLTTQEPLYTTTLVSVNKFAGTRLTTTNAHPCLITIQPLNKNWEQIREGKTQKFLIYPHSSSYIPNLIKSGFITGSIIRFATFSTHQLDLLKATIQFLTELRSLGYNIPKAITLILSYIHKKCTHRPDLMPLNVLATQLRIWRSLKKTPPLSFYNYLP